VGKSCDVILSLEPRKSAYSTKQEFSDVDAFPYSLDGITVVYLLLYAL
jgi:hypothetical protein